MRKAQSSADEFKPVAGGLLVEPVLGVMTLQRWAKAQRERYGVLATREREKPKAARSAKARKTTDHALKALIKGLGRIWSEVFEKKPTTMVGNPVSPQGAKPGGPFLAFLQACLEPLHIDLTDEAVRARVRTEFQGKGSVK